MKLRWRLSLICLLVASGCVVPRARFAPRYLYLEVDGDTGATAAGATLTSDIQTLGLDDEEGNFSPRADLWWVGSHLSLSYLDASFDGRGQTEAAIEIGGDVIAAGVDVDSDLNFKSLDAIMTWDVVPSEFVELGLGFGVSLIDFEFDIIDDLGNQVSTDESLPVPFVAGRLGVNVHRFDLDATAGLIDIEVSDIDLSFLNLDLSAQYLLFGGKQRASGRIIVGYRSFDVDAEYEDGNSDVEADFRIDGPYFGVSVTF